MQIELLPWSWVAEVLTDWPAQVREIVAYAKQRFIEVVPEIELPGHCCAALACYPHLSCKRQLPFVSPACCAES